MLMFGLVFAISSAHGSGYNNIWHWPRATKPDIVICDDAKTTVETVRESIRFWSSKGYSFGRLLTNNTPCKYDWYEGTVMIRGESGLSTETYNAFSTPWHDINTKKLLSVVIQFEDSNANVQELVNHELGHALGLEHTNDHKDVMYGGPVSY